MSFALAAILVLTVSLAAANGSNDDAKGVATLAGAGVTRYRFAIAWGVLATLAGSLLSLTFASSISTLFTSGIVAAPPDPAFSIAVLAGTAFWVGLATATRLPVSTTHAIVGALIGAGLLLAPGSVKWLSLATKVAIPLLASVVLSYAASALLSRVARSAPQCVGLDLGPPSAVEATGAAKVSGAGLAAVAGPSRPLPMDGVITSTSSTCPIHSPGTARIGLNVNTAHWLTSGGASFARGLNDTPKIWAIGAFGLVPGMLGPSQLLVLVAVAMAFGGAVAAGRVGRQLGENVVHMSHREGFNANLVTAVLVGAGANLGLPMSMTQVSTGAISGIAGTQVRRLNVRSLRNFLIAWTATPAVAGVIALLVFFAIRQT